MYRVLIVDDEPIIRKGLINFIQWSSIDCKVIGEAENGIDAKELIQSSAPDIVISDIKMPGIDGIGLSEFIYNNYPNIKIILLTGYSDFKYAQSAIRYNVVDFVLKPSSNENIIEAVNKAKKIISDEKVKQNKLQNLESRLDESLSLVREKFLLDLINGVFIDNENIKDKMDYLEMNLEEYYLLVFEIENSHKFNQDIDNVKEPNTIKEIKKFISLIFKDYNHNTVITSSYSFCSIISCSEKTSSNFMQDIITKCQELINFVNNFMGISISLGISNYHKSLYETKFAYEEAQKSISQKFFEENNIFTYSDIFYNENKNLNVLSNKHIDKIIQLIKSGDEDAAVLSAKELFDEFKSSKVPIEYIKNTGILICSLCSKLISNYSIDICIIIKDWHSMYTNILQCDSIKTLFSILENVIRNITLYLSQLNTENNYIIRKAKKYIDKNYQNTIKLETLADYVHVNSSYLSRLFKKQTGCTLTEIITKIRIKKAKDLLTNTSLKTYEVALKVGIEDAAYFSQVFKKYTGFSPSEYKKTL